MEELKIKHYIAVDTNKYIVEGFSDAFVEPLETNICINEDAGRHFELLGIVNPQLININGTHNYKYVNNVVVATTEEEKVAEFATFPVPEHVPTEIELLQNQIVSTNATMDSILTELIPSMLELIAPTTP